MHQKKRVELFVIAMLVCVLCSPALAIILHEDGEPDGSWTDIPNDLVVGRWSWNASFVVIAPNWLATTRHQNTDPATVTIDGVNYNCHYDSQWAGGLGTADIRLIRLTTANNENPNLASYAIPYTNTDEIDKDVVIGGHGNGRDTTLTTRGTAYGYTWDYISNNSSPLRWGTNTIDGTASNDTINTLTSDVLTADFDKLPSNPIDNYECINAIYDSGGGWFIFDDSQWKVAGLVRAIEPHGDNWPNDAESWFRSSTNPNTAHADYFDAVRISSYASWITPIITCTGDMPGDVNDDCNVNSTDLRNLALNWLRDDCDGSNDNCDGADTDATDGKVDMIDFARVAVDWLTAN